MTRARPAQSRVRRWVWTSVLVGLVVLLVLLFSRYGVLTRWRVESQYQEVRSRYERLRWQADSLQRRIERLRSDERELERLAREQYGMARPGETVYVIPGGHGVGR